MGSSLVSVMMEFDKLIKDFKTQSIRRSRRDNKNIFDICGFPHYENVVSNLLAFFFDSTEDHSLSTLVIKALVDAAGIAQEINDLQFNVEREVRTDQGNFIDILLYNESYCIVIENKINASIYNDLRDYLAYARKHTKTQPTGIVLSIHKIDDNHQLHGFINITYPVFIKHIKQNLGFHINNGHNKFLFLLFELINNIESLFNPGGNMNYKFIQFIKDNQDTVLDFGRELKKFHDDLRELVRKVNDIVRNQINDPDVKQWPYRELPELNDVAVSDFKLHDGTGLCLCSIVDASGWKFELFIRKATNKAFDLESHCKSNGLTGSMREGRFILDEHLDLNTKPQEVATKIVEIIKKG